MSLRCATPGPGPYANVTESQWQFAGKLLKQLAGANPEPSRDSALLEISVGREAAVRAVYGVNVVRHGPVNDDVTWTR